MNAEFLGSISAAIDVNGKDIPSHSLGTAEALVSMDAAGPG
jgi:hypothetical protein